VVPVVAVEHQETGLAVTTLLVAAVLAVCMVAAAVEQALRVLVLLAETAVLVQTVTLL
jgi:hypothetical protein